MIKKYLQQLISVLMGLTILLTILIILINANHLFNKWFLLIPVITLLLGVGFVYPLQAVLQKPQTLFLWFGLNMGVKMVVSAVFVIAMIQLLNLSLLCFAGTYLVYYLSLLTIETLWLIKRN